MDYTPISTRRVLLAFAFTAIVAVVPVLFVLLDSRSNGTHSLIPDTEGDYRGLVLGAGSLVLTVFLIGAPMLMVAIGRRIVRRPTRA